MEPLAPRITIQNMTGMHWQVRLEYTWSAQEQLDCTVLVRKDPALPLGQLDLQVLRALKAHVDRMVQARQPDAGGASGP